MTRMTRPGRRLRSRPAAATAASVSLVIMVAIVFTGCSGRQDNVQREKEGSALKRKAGEHQASETVGAGHLKPLLAGIRGADAATALEVFQHPRTRADEMSQVLMNKVTTFERYLGELAASPGVGPGRTLFADSRRTVEPGPNGHDGIYLIPTERNWVVVAGERIEPIFISSLIHGVMWDIAFELKNGQRIPRTLVGVASDDVKSASLVDSHREEIVAITTRQNTIFARIPHGTRLEELKELRVLRKDGSSEWLRIQQ
jgi:hypothetical protein